MSDGTAFSLLLKKYIYIDGKGFYIWEGSTYSFKSDDQKMRSCSLSKDLKVIRERALHRSGERTVRIDKTGSANALRYKSAPAQRNFYRNSEEAQETG